ncbi:hypothetical protein BDA99DRAFT_526480 [Phascolomyces articulosus]|uniref:F-box domain-containing protein n=1 Tax=Phascolomyces articulosus TaxID=60185 RepID=A0AAD5JNE2_9FUNG|nr:hypothetical protein BDA99DRAFT_526480 [Phascolomyces articulosus]
MQLYFCFKKLLLLHMTTTLQHSNKVSNQESQRQVDFVLELPNEIVPLIMKHFETIELLNLLTVSKQWKDQLVACKSLWFNIVFHGHTPEWNETSIIFNKMRDSIPFIDIAVQLKLVGLSSSEDMTTTIPLLLKPLVCGAYVQLEYLELCGCFIGEQPIDLDKAVDAVSNTLRYLKIMSIFPKPTTLYFENILASCQLLEGFWFDSSVILFPRRHHPTATETVTTAGDIPPPSRIASTLKQLIINVDPIHNEHVERIINLCPNLQRIYMNVIDSHTAVDIILRYYDEYQLEYLNINMYLCLLTNPPCSTWSPFEYIQKNENKNTKSNKQQQSKEGGVGNMSGLRYLALRGFDETTLASLLHRHANTLEELYVYYNNTRSPSHRSSNNIPTTQNVNNDGLLSELRVLSISSSHDPTFMLATLLTRVSPKTLQTLQIGSCNLSNNPNVLSSIKALHSLKCLHLHHSIYAHHGDIMDLLHHFATKSEEYHHHTATTSSDDDDQEQRQQLRSLLLSSTYFQIINDAILQELGKIQTLEEIAIHDAIKVTDQGMDSFCVTLQHYNKHLRSLTLNHVPAAKSTTLRHLLSIPTLETIILRNVNSNIKLQDFPGFIEQGIQIEIYHTSP